MLYPDSEFEIVYRQYYDRVYAFLYKLCGNHTVCEDLTQETFYQAYISLLRYDGSCSLFTWLAAIAKNVFFKYLRKNKYALLRLECMLPEFRENEESNPEISLFDKEEIRRLRTAIESLPSHYRDVLLLRIYGELSYSEIASKLKISENSAKVLFFRTKKILKEKLNHE